MSSLPKLNICTIVDVVFGEGLPPAQGPVYPIPGLRSLAKFTMESSRAQTRHSILESIDVLSPAFSAMWSLPLPIQQWAYTVNAIKDLAPQGKLQVSLSPNLLWIDEGTL